MEIKDILKQPISRNPISANFIKSAKPEKLMIEPVRTVASFDEKGKENIELWNYRMFRFPLRKNQIRKSIQSSRQ